MYPVALAEIMAEIFAYREDVWEPTLRRMGFYPSASLFICMDAYDDVEEDVKKRKLQSIFRSLYNRGVRGTGCSSMLMMMLAEACREFEKLPIIKYTDILTEYPVFRMYGAGLRRFPGKRKRRTGERRCLIHTVCWACPGMHQTKKSKKLIGSSVSQYHPDANINNPNKAQAEEKFKEVQQAYEQIMKEREYGSSGNGQFL